MPVKKYKIELHAISANMRETLIKASRKHDKAIPLAEIHGHTITALINRKAAKVQRKMNKRTGKREAYLVLTERGKQLRKAL